MTVAADTGGAPPTTSQFTGQSTGRSNGGVSFRLAFAFALRELRGGLSGFYVFLACIALGVGAISGVNAVALSITQGISEEGRT
ncbi:MAG: hypothetical protein AAGM04_09760, partial [Pseudomonadota bacterium]